MHPSSESSIQEPVSPYEDLLFKKLNDPLFLPTRSQLDRAFGPQGFQPITLSNFYLNQDNTVHSHEVLHKEMIDALSAYIRSRAQRLLKDNPTYKTCHVIEVAAGTGRLSHFLQRNIPEDEAIFHPTDSGTWNIPHEMPVEKIDAYTAMKKYNPQMALCSWMPYQLELSCTFRQTPSVQEFVLLGNENCCGVHSDTWYGDETFERIELPSITQHQIGAMDQRENERDNYSMGGVSSAASFRRL